MAMSFSCTAAYSARRLRSLIASSIPNHAHTGDRRSARRRFGGWASAVIACASIAATSIVATAAAAPVCAPPGDAKLVARYTTPVRGWTDELATSTLQLDADGSFRWSGLPGPPKVIGGCWRREGDIVRFETRALDGGDGVKRAMPEPLTQADLDRVTRYEHKDVRTIAQAVEAGLLANGRLWAYQTRGAGEPVRVKLYEPTIGIPPGDAKVTLTLADGQVVEGAQLSEDDQVIDRHPRPAGGEYLFTSLPRDAAIKSIGIVFADQPDRPRTVPIEGATRLLYMIEFDANDTGSIFGGVMRLKVLANGNLDGVPPDSGPAFERVP